MDGVIVTTTTEIPVAVGLNYGKGQAKDKYGDVVDVYNLDRRRVISIGTRCEIMHAAGGMWHINKVEC